MRFSKRLKWDTALNPIAQLRGELERAGKQVLDLTESNPTAAGLVYSPVMLEGLASEQALKYEPDPRGWARAREAVAEYYAARGLRVPEDRILLTASTSEAYTYLFKLLADPGEEVLVPRPSYPLFEFLASLEAVEVGQYPLRYDGAWHIDFAALEARLTQRTRAVVVVNPNNPTGSFLKRSELERLDELCAARGVALISDEVFCDYGFPGDPERVETIAGERKALSFSMSGLSKVAGLPQLKLGWMVVSGPGQREAYERLEWIADTFLSVGTPVQVALEGLIAAGLGVQRQIRERTAANLAWLKSKTAASALQVLNVEGGWYAVVQVPRTRSEEKWTLGLLREQGVLVQPGFFYDFEAEAFLVLSLLTPEAVFREGLGRILKAV